MWQLTMHFKPDIALFLRHDPHLTPPAIPRATDFSDPPRSAPQQLSIAPERSGAWQSPPWNGPNGPNGDLRGGTPAHLGGSLQSN